MIERWLMACQDQKARAGAFPNRYVARQYSNVQGVQYTFVWHDFHPRRRKRRTIGYGAPILAARVGIVLKERLKAQTFVAVLAGLVGVAVIVQPGFKDDDLWFYVIPLLGAMGAAVATLSVRILSRTETTSTLLVYQAGFIGALSGVSMFWFWESPDLAGATILIGIALCATLGQWSGIHALRLGEVRIVGPIEYSRAVHAVFFGWLFFHEAPEPYTLVGAGLIIVACILAAHQGTGRMIR
ncbi:DMT family transporter [Sulfitobacter sp. JB4-11]|uniref:DMT family transporter n=1 Tax=Sulfitobacter rhodophyticola TaxID=3238304 RepID=UPI003512901A